MSSATLLSIGCLFAASLLSAGTAPTIASGYGREINVDGTADPTAGPIAILDISYPAQTRIGGGAVNGDGSFGVVVNPALIAGHSLVAVDSQGRRSAAFAVAPPRSGPVPGSRPQ